MFTPEQRDHLRDAVLALAGADDRVVAAAEVGSLADAPGDAYSDLDLTFGVADADDIGAVLDSFTGHLASEHRAVHLFDLPHRTSIYRVFLLPGCLQVDLSFTPAADFGPRGPRFRLLFGSIVREEQPLPPDPRFVAGLAAHHAVRARFCIIRGRVWQAVYWLGALREQTLELTCIRHGLEPAHGRSLDRLPAEELAAAEPLLVRSSDPAELERALQQCVDALLREAAAITGMPPALDRELRGLLVQPQA
jgi:hypothetical protein